MNRNVMAIVAVAGFVSACAPLSQTPAAPAGSPAKQQLSADQGTSLKGSQPSPEAATSFSGIGKADHDIAEIYAGKDKLAGTVVNVRGKVVKFSSMIMGRNWVHIQDGSGSSGTNDLTVTTTGTAKLGDIVLVTGTVTLNKDFGSGYKYALIFEDAKVFVEAP